MTTQISNNLELSDIKISHKLNNKNIFKKLIYNIENQKKSGWIYKTICILCLIYILTFQYFSFIQKNNLGFMILPISLMGVLTVCCCYFDCFFNRKNLNTFGTLILLCYYSMVIITVLSFKLYIDKNHIINFFTFLIPLNPFHNTNSYINYGIIVGVMIILLPLLNNFYRTYYGYIYIRRHLNFSPFSKVLFFSFFSFCIYISTMKLYEKILATDSLYATFLILIIISGLTAYILFLFSVFALDITKKISLLLNKY